MCSESFLEKTSPEEEWAWEFWQEQDSADRGEREVVSWLARAVGEKESRSWRR
jgi:hypothetical protein